MTSLLPIVHRELLLASRRKGTYWLRCGTAALAGGVLFAMVLTSDQPPARTSQMIFWALKVLTFAFCLFAGVRYTADALSEERREGTLGLLFLTDLRGHDVVIGKLAITSLNAFFGLLAALPLLAVPVLMGGISIGEVWRITLVLINTLFFSLAVGLAVSAFGKQERNVLLGAFFWILLVSFGLPLFWYNAAKFSNARWIEYFFLFPSPAYTLKLSASGLFVSVPSDFWGCMLTVAGVSLGCVIMASIALPRVSAESSHWSNQSARSSPVPQQIRGFDLVRSLALRRWQLSRPYFWRVSRDPSMGRWCLLFAVVALVFGLYGAMVMSNQNARPAQPWIMIGWLAAHWLIKLLWTAEACRPFCEDKRCGALELLLCTPLGPKEMTSAQCRRLDRTFALPIGVICVMSFLLASANPDNILDTILTLGIFTLPADCWALRWTSMHSSLARPTFAKAYFSALGRVLLPPWIALVAIMAFLASISASESTVRSILVMWGCGVLTYDFCLTSWSRIALGLAFRPIASGEAWPVKNRPFRSPNPAIRPATAVSAVPVQP